MRWVGAVLLAIVATTGATQTITSAEFSDPTKRYAHGILGDAVEWGSLKFVVRHPPHQGADGKSLSAIENVKIELPQDHVFEDNSPRLWDVTSDGHPEVVVVETDVSAGAALAIYGADGAKITETPHIGRRNRWLAPIGAADLDGDGHIEIAYVDRPHLVKSLRVFRYKDRQLREVTAVDGFTNHRIGERDIAGGIRTCDGSPEMIVASADWSRLMAVRLTGGRLVARDIGPHKNRRSFARAMACK